MSNRTSRFRRDIMEAHRDPDGFALLERHTAPDVWNSRLGLVARTHISTLLIAKGGLVRDITVGDCLELREVETAIRGAKGGRSLFYALMRDAGLFPADAPATLRDLIKFAGPLSVEQLVDRYKLRCRPVRDLIVDYLAERQAAMDYTTLDGLSRCLALHFWKNLEEHHPEIDSLHLAPEVAAAWKTRLQNRVVRRRTPDGGVSEHTQPRDSYVEMLSYVRMFYLDIAQWALEEPARWGPWAVPCPIKDSETSYRKQLSRRKARMDQRTRERLPALPALVRAAEQHYANAKARLDALAAVEPGERFSVLGETYVRPAPNRKNRTNTSAFAYDLSGQRHMFDRAEGRAFWGWAAIEVLRHSGIRIEELLELTHHSITQYRLPGTREIIPLLQIVPSKTDTERLLVVSPELADVLSAIVKRVRGEDGSIPLIASYDPQERIWNPPMPFLFQWTIGGQARVISANTIRRAINDTLHLAGLCDASGQPLQYSPHDFRRLFATEAILNGMPPHIAQLLLGHKDINTTMGYKAIYPEEAINGHRAFIARRRALRPGSEYRTPTDQEWDEFLGHFERRKVALGECGRAYGTSCQHEHSCIRCPLLRVDPDERGRLEKIHTNLTDRIAEAEREGWLGEAENLEVSRAAAEDKLAQLDARARRAATINLGIPAFREVAGRTALLPATHQPNA